MPTSLALNTSHPDNGNLHLIAVGEIDLSNIEAFTQALTAAAAAAAHSGGLTVDLTAVEYLDSAAINALASRAEQLRNLLVHPVLMTTVTVSGLAELVSIDACPPEQITDRSSGS